MKYKAGDKFIEVEDEPQTECDTNCPFWDDRAGVCMRIGKCPTVKGKPHTERNE